MMYMTHYGALVPPKHKKYGRKVAKGPREHFTGQMNIGESDDEWIIDVESHTEMMVALILDGRQDVASFENQVLFEWIDQHGVTTKHFFDFRAFLKDGTKIAIFVKADYRMQSVRLQNEMAMIASQVPQSFADRVVIMTEKHIDPVEAHNAELFHEVRQDEPEIDALARRSVLDIVGAVRVEDLMDEIGCHGQGFRAIVRLIRSGELELVQHERISPESSLRRRMQ